MNITLMDIQQNMPCSVSYYTSIAAAWQQMVVELSPRATCAQPTIDISKRLPQLTLKTATIQRSKAGSTLSCLTNTTCSFHMLRWHLSTLVNTFTKTQDSQDVMVETVEMVETSIWTKFHATSSTNHRPDVE